MQATGISDTIKYTDAVVRIDSPLTVMVALTVVDCDRLAPVGIVAEVLDAEKEADFAPETKAPVDFVAEVEALPTEDVTRVAVRVVGLVAVAVVLVTATGVAVTVFVVVAVVLRVAAEAVDVFVRVVVALPVGPPCVAETAYVLDLVAMALLEAAEAVSVFVLVVVVLPVGPARVADMEYVLDLVAVTLLVVGVFVVVTLVEATADFDDARDAVRVTALPRMTVD